MKLSGILREAAQRVEAEGGIFEDYEFSCIAVYKTALRYGNSAFADRAEDAYVRLLLGPAFLYPSHFIVSGDSRVPHEVARNHRVLALCMAATLADEEGL